MEKCIKIILEELDKICNKVFYRRADDDIEGVYVVFKDVNYREDRNKVELLVDINVWGGLEDSLDMIRITDLIDERFTDYLKIEEGFFIYSLYPRIRSLDEDTKIRNLIEVEFTIF